MMTIPALPRFTDLMMVVGLRIVDLIAVEIVGVPVIAEAGTVVDFDKDEVTKSSAEIDACIEVNLSAIISIGALLCLIGFAILIVLTPGCGC
jgi:hypothetical protein